MDSEILATLKSIDDKLDRQNKIGKQGVAEIGSAFWGAGFLMSAGRNWFLISTGDPSGSLFAPILSWGNVGWLLAGG